MTDEHDEHVYYFAWLEKDNPDVHSQPLKFRVFRSHSSPVAHDPYVSEPMSRQEAKELCSRIVKLTGGVEIL